MKRTDDEAFSVGQHVQWKQFQAVQEVNLLDFGGEFVCDAHFDCLYDTNEIELE